MSKNGGGTVPPILSEPDQVCHKAVDKQLLEQPPNLPSDEEKKDATSNEPPSSPPIARKPPRPHPLAKFAVYRSPPSYKTKYNTSNKLYAKRLMLPANYTLNLHEATRLNNVSAFPSIHDLWEVASLKASAHNYGESDSLTIPRSILPASSGAYQNVHVSKQVTDTRTITVLSYSVLCQEVAKDLPYISHKVSNWLKRRERLLREIFSFNADVMCLQDVDDFKEWWRPQLSQAGYDAVYRKRTTHLRPRQEGVVVAYKRDTFQMFRSQELELNDAVTDDIEDRNLAERSRTDHVGIMLCLQPWEKCDDPSGVLICNVGLEDDENLEAVRMLQSQYVAQEVAKFNKDFQLPIILAGTLNCTPGGKVYEVLTTGMTPVDPQPPGKPVGDEVVVSLDRFHGAKALSHSSIVLEWRECEDLDQGLSPPVEGYWVTWRIGGNQNLAFKDKQYYPKKVCCRDESDPDLRRCYVTGLASGVTYEFKVAGYNECGTGEWTRISKPICTMKLHSKLASGPPPTKRKVVVESKHPYKPGMDIKEKVMLKGCKFGARVEFDRKCKMEPDADILCFYEDDTFDEVMTARDLEGDEVNCVFDSEYRTTPEDFPTIVEVCRECEGKGDLGIDRELCYGFFSDDVNEYWGYRFNVYWDDWTENMEFEAEMKALKEEREGTKGKWLKDIEEVKDLQEEEERDRIAAKKRVEEIRKKLVGTIIINGKETVLPVSQITPRFMDGTENSLVAPVRKQQLTMFPEYGNRGEDPDLVDDFTRLKKRKEEDEEAEQRTKEENEGEGSCGKGAEEEEDEDEYFNMYEDEEESRPQTPVPRHDQVLSSEQTHLSPLLYAWHKDATKSHEQIVGNEIITGTPDLRQIHFLRLKSAYRGYCTAGEPLYTCVDGRGATTSDYILASEETLVCTEVLSIPELGGGDWEDLNGRIDAQQRELAVDMNYDLDVWDSVYKDQQELELERRHRALEEKEAKNEEEEAKRKEEEEEKWKEEYERWQANKQKGGKKSRKSAPPPPPPKKKDKGKQGSVGGGAKKKYKKKAPFTFYQGSTQPLLRPNTLASHSAIPNAEHPSNHFPIVAKFRFVSSHLSGFWHGGQE